jgi:hypothetical protein
MTQRARDRLGSEIAPSAEMTVKTVMYETGAVHGGVYAVDAALRNISEAAPTIPSRRWTASSWLTHICRSPPFRYGP